MFIQDDKTFPLIILVMAHVTFKELCQSVIFWLYFVLYNLRTKRGFIGVQQTEHCNQIF